MADIQDVCADHAEDRQIDVVALGIVTAAILLFVATGSEVGPAVVRSILERGPGPDNFILNAFLLNIAIIIFGWSRYRQLCDEIKLRKRAERQARLLAETDPLTGYLNRRSFNTGVAKLLADNQAEDRAVVLMMIDLDNFKQINDYNGHKTGDLLLQECARRISASLPQQAIVGRIGGDEFAVALAFDKGRDEILDRVAESLVDRMSRPIAIEALRLEVTASVGLARSDLLGIDEELPDARTLLERADIAMYHAKRRGRNSYYWFEAQMADEMRFRSEIEHGIRQGIPRQEFVPFYEQQIDLQTGKLIGFEMLARWDSPKFGIVAPDLFIPIAEEIGAIADLSESVISQALEDAKTWDDHLTLSVNISPLQLRDPWFAQKLIKLLIEAKFPPHRLEIEITESCLHQNIGLVRSLITSLKNQGIKVSLDDFGTGYSSLAQLRSLPFDRIKIDRSFVSSLVDNKDSAAIVNAIAQLGKGLDMPITAEGIENGAVLERLMEFGSITGQGYYYGRPQPAREVSEWLGGIELIANRQFLESELPQLRCAASQEVPAPQPEAPDAPSDPAIKPAKRA
ncbi:putative bifunctional diguanylate cyclase/phosphodiesterase [Novosphingobium pentaromativorans]|uniref:Diguanylate cyclase/phosphodiesterase n=1 Tax=Novosphingobium pentaromativorans US6-1 TaxID=1088721 RepID=G6EEZ5_9SPHN|nr:diguanylate cyclase [Novosphingobium pentaromativorans US6-1]EHJ60121.1 diguanylate cyclase/phosphodiesterase [Novosphingobium pentaromativorans US6-1]